jgi:hypothetical protein
MERSEKGQRPAIENIDGAEEEAQLPVTMEVSSALGRGDLTTQTASFRKNQLSAG